MTDRYRLNLFYQPNKTVHDYLYAQEISDDVFSASDLLISILSVDFPEDTTRRYRKHLEKRWVETLPKLGTVQRLSVRHRVDQEFFDAICTMKGLKELHIWCSSAKEIMAISKLKDLHKLRLDSFSQVTDISPLLALENLELLSIENSFKIRNYGITGQMKQLNGLRLVGDTIAPKNLRLPSLIPFKHLNSLRHLDLSNTSVIDGSYAIILELEALERFDTTLTIPKPTRDKILAQHENLKAGLFVDWDFDNKRLRPGKEW